MRGLLVAGAVVLVVWLLTPSIVGTAASIIYSPIMSVRNWLLYSTDNVPLYFQNREALHDQVRSLEERLATSIGLRVSVARLREENEVLRRLLGDDAEGDIAANILARPPHTPYDSLVIDKGSRDGVGVSAPVYVAHDQVVGFVSEVYSSSAVVVLASAPGYESTAYIIGPDIYTIAVGMGGGVLQVRVPQGIAIAPGDVVVLPALSAGVYGEISHVESIPTEPEQYGYVTVTSPLQSFRGVRVGSEVLSPLSFEEARAVVASVRSDLLTVPVPDGVLVEVKSTTTATSSAEVSASSTATSSIERQ